MATKRTFYCGLRSKTELEHVIWIKSFSADGLVSAPARDRATKFTPAEIAKLIVLLDTAYSNIFDDREFFVEINQN